MDERARRQLELAVVDEEDGSLQLASLRRLKEAFFADRKDDELMPRVEPLG